MPEGFDAAETLFEQHQIPYIKTTAVQKMQVVSGMKHQWHLLK